MIAFVDREWTGEIANRLRGVGRYHASRLVVLAYEPRRERLDARVMIAADGEPEPGELALLRETVVVELGDRHLDDLLTIADPLVVTDLPTLLWSPHGHHDIVQRAARALPGGAAWTPSRSPTRAEALDRACALSEQRLRRRPRVAALDAVARAAGRHLRPARAAPRAAHGQRGHRAPPSRLDRRRDAARRAGWPRGCGGSPAPLVAHGDGARRQGARAAARTWSCAWRPPPSCGAGASRTSTIETASGRRLSLSRGTGGLRARTRDRARRASASGRSPEPRAARPACSARASARRCCATRPTSPRWRAARALAP